MKFYLCRHGQTHWNAERRLQGRLQSELNETGVAQANQLAQKAKHWNVDWVVSSHLNRAAVTASICAKVLAAEHTQYTEFAERDFGQWQGKSIAGLKSFKAFRSTCYDNVLARPNDAAENTLEVRSRFTRRLTELARTQSNSKRRTIMLVSHGDAIDSFITQWTHPHYLKNSEHIVVEFINGDFVVHSGDKRAMPTAAV